MLEPTARAECRRWHPALDIDLFATIQPAALPPCASMTEAAVAMPGAAASFSIPAGYVLIERELLGRVVKRLKAASERERAELTMPAFLANPSWEYLDAMGRR
jgi:hypothetical protein